MAYYFLYPKKIYQQIKNNINVIFVLYPRSEI